MRFIRKILILLALLPGLAPARTSLAEVDRLLSSRAQNIHEFLRDPALQNDYYEALKDYYGGELPRESFVAILKELAHYLEVLPELGERLWAPSPRVETLSIRLDVSSRGLELRQNIWEDFLRRLESSLGQKSTGAQVSSGLARQMTDLVSELEAVDRRLAAVSRKERGPLAGSLYGALLERPAHQRVLAWIARGVIFHPSHRDLLFSGEADLVLETWSRISGLREIQIEDTPVPERLLKLALKTHLPELKTPPLEVQNGKPLQTDFFRVSTRKARNGMVALGQTKSSAVTLTTLPRALHGIWKGVPLKECVGGSCVDLSHLSARRWATAAIKGARVFNVEKNGSYHGFIQTVPLEIAGRNFEGIEFGSPLLNVPTLQRLPDGGLRRARILDLVLDRLSEHRLPTSQGFVVGQSKSINNAGVLDGLFKSFRYLVAAVGVGVANLQSLKDPLIETLVERINEFETSRSKPSRYSDTMVVDALLKDAVFLRMIAPVEIPVDDLERARALIGNFKKLRDPRPPSERLPHQSFLAEVLRREVPVAVAVTALIELSVDAAGRVQGPVLEALMKGFPEEEKALFHLFELSRKGLVTSSQLTEGMDGFLGTLGRRKADSDHSMIGFGLLDDPLTSKPAEKLTAFETHLMKNWRHLPGSSRDFWLDYASLTRGGEKVGEWLLVEALRAEKSLESRDVSWLGRQIDKLSEFESFTYLKRNDLQRLQKAFGARPGAGTASIQAMKLETIEAKLAPALDDASSAVRACSRVFGP